jgi:long-chain acyl-CoA synthetase
VTTQVDAVRRAAERYPGDVALSYFGRSLTYIELDRISDEVALQFSRHVTSGDVVALCTQNIPQFPIVELAAWKLGCTVLPLNPSYTSREITYNLKDSGAKLVVSQSDAVPAAREAIKGLGRRIILYSTNPGTLSRVPPELAAKWGFVDGDEELHLTTDGEKRLIPKKEERALLVYTSGTTGEPKGAVITNSNLNHAASVYKKWFRFTPRDRVLGFAPFFHVTGLVFHLAAVFLSRASVVMGGRFDAGLVLRTVEDCRTTVTMMAATAYLSLLNEPFFPRSDLSSMRLWSSGGMPVPRRLEEDWKQRTGHWIYVAWGLTETTSPATLWPYPFSGELPVDTKSGVVSSGIPVYDTHVKVLDEGGRRVAEGEVGEIAVKGPQVIRQYLNKPEATSNSIRDGWLLTGDVAFVREGWVYIVDRKKDMINSSGFKVWPREVEEVLYAHPAIEEAVVVGVPDPYRGESVKAFVKLKSGHSPDGRTRDDILTKCRKELAPYKVPRQLEFVDGIPKTLTGKLLRRAFRGK